MITVVVVVISAVEEEDLRPLMQVNENTIIQNKSKKDLKYSYTVQQLVLFVHNNKCIITTAQGGATWLE